MNLRDTLGDLTKLARQHGWTPLAGYHVRNEDWQWLNLTRGRTHLDIEWEPSLPTGCQIHASQVGGPRIEVNVCSVAFVRQAIIDFDGWMTATTALRDSTIHLDEVA